MALTIYKQSPVCYRFLRSSLVLPSVRTLKEMLKSISMQPGKMHFLMRHIYEKTKIMEPEDRHCVLMWDEVALSPHLDYDSQQDEIVGFEDWGEVCTNKIADHALVFMAKGLHSEWKLPLAFHFCASQTKHPQLVRCIKEVIEEISKAGLIVQTTVCDQGSSNIAAIKTLKAETRAKKLKADENYGIIFSLIKIRM